MATVLFQKLDGTLYTPEVVSELKARYKESGYPSQVFDLSLMTQESFESLNFKSGSMSVDVASAADRTIERMTKVSDKVVVFLLEEKNMSQDTLFALDQWILKLKAKHSVTIV